MANGDNTGQSSYRTGATTGYPAPEQQTVSQAAGPCSCHGGGTQAPSACCDLTCFERPRYFCGHLLTDADLSLDQRYVIEKQKLYHRALHGSGIVCGLRLTCHPQCCDNIVVGEGFGIDDCGNDLVLCQPEPFNVIARLREKKLLIPAPKPEDCPPGVPPEECVIPQCFYVVACYEEDGQEYATPLTPGCGPSLGDCEPTRIRETVRIDVVDKLPEQTSPLDKIEGRIKHCFKLFTEGPFAQEIKSQTVQDALEGSADPGRHKEFCDTLCRLRALLRFYLDVHPDQYNCRIKDDVDAVKCPAEPASAANMTENDRKNYQSTFQNAFCRLVELAYGHVMACVMGELAFPCAEPVHASCIVLGTVTVENDCVLRICNCPRTYVWSFASFFQVLMATLFGSLACKSDEDTQMEPSSRYGPGNNMQTPDEASPMCCVEFKPAGGCSAFVNKVREGGSALSDLVTATLAAVKGTTGALRYALDPTRTDTLLLNGLRGRKLEDISELMRSRHIQFEPEPASENPVPPHPFDALSSYFHQTKASQLVITHREGLVVDVQERALHDRLTALEVEVKSLRAQLGASGDKAGGGGAGAVKRSRRTGQP